MDFGIIEKEPIVQLSIPLAEQIVKYFTSAIVGGELKTGQQLVEAEFQRKFGTSRAPIREAFRILEENGLLVSVARKGTFVREITRKSIEENFPVRAHLESFAARLAAPLLRGEDIQAMEVALSGMMESGRANDVRSHLQYHNSFHRTFINATNNDTLIKILSNLRQQAMWFRFSYLSVMPEDVAFEYAMQVHREILDGFIEKDVDRLEILIKEHILVTLDRFLQALDSRAGVQAEVMKA